MKKMLMMCAVVVGLVAHAEPTVTSVKAQQRYPWNGLVDIVVTLEGSAEEMPVTEWSFAATNCATGAAIPVTSITQKGSDMGSGTIWKRRFVWDAATDVGAVKIDDVALTVDAKVVREVQLWENGPYWAESNVGATKPEEYGYYFWWGDTVGYKRNAANNGWISVKDGSSFTFTSGNCPTYGKNNSQLQSAGYIDATGNLVAAHDAAMAHLGAPWRMPTDSEIDALISNCDTQWTTRNGVYGRLVTGRGAYASKSIFLPAAGLGNDSSLSYTGSFGFFWSSSPNSDTSSGAWDLVFDSGYIYRGSLSRYYGQSVRPLRGFANGAMPGLQAGAGVTTHLKLDCRTGTRTAAESETITYSTEWVEGAGEGAVAVVSVNGEVISEQSGSGAVKWTPKSYGTNTLTHQVKLDSGQIGETLTARFEVAPLPEGGPYKETVGGIEWTFMVDANLNASVGTGEWEGWAIPRSTKGVVAIPTKLGGRTVMSIGGYAFFDCGSLTNVTIPSSVTSIGINAFGRCFGLTSVAIPSGVTSIGDGAFSGCAGLRSVTISEGVTSIGDGAFNNCFRLTSVTMSEGVKSIGDGAFYWCEALTSIAIPSSVTSIGNGAFSKCYGLSAINVRPDNGAYSSQDGILYNKDMTALLLWPCGKQGVCVVSSVVTSIEQGAFSECGGLSEIVVDPDNATYSSQDGVLFNKDKTALLRCPAGKQGACVVSAVVTSVGQGAFEGYGRPLDFEGAPPEGIENAGINQDVTICYNVAYEAQWLPVIERCGWTNAKPYTPGEPRPAGGPYVEVVDGVAWTFMVDTNFNASVGTGNYESPAIPQSTEGAIVIPTKLGGRTVTSIGDEAFAYCSSLTSVTIPSSVTSIGWGVFQSCAGLVSVTMSEGMTIIGDGMFYECTSLTSVTIPSSVTSVGQQAFYYCTNLTSVAIPSSVTSIGAHAFSECGGLQSIEVDAGNAYYSSQDGVLFDKDKITLLQYAGGKKGAYTIPSSVTSIGDCAFDYCSGLTSVTISEGVTSIGYAAFWGCGSLTSVTLCSSVESIGSCVFEDCVNLNAVDFEGAPPDGVANARIKQDAAIRYNVAYETQWLPVIEQCGWTNATPYDPFPSMPVISPESGTTFEGSSLSVSMTCASEEATIHYTTDGSEPTMESPVYRRFKVYGKTTVKAIAFYEDGKASEMAVAEYARGVCEEPTVTPPDGTMFEHSGQVVSLAHDNPEGVLRYTTDGNDPTPESPEYTEPFTIDETTVVKAKVFGDQYFDSGIVTATLTRVWVKVATPVITAPTSFTGSQQKVEIACTTEGATVRYTTNGQDPNSHSPKYTKPFYVTDTTTVKAYATKADYVKSDIAACTIAKVWAIGDTMGKPDHTFETGGDFGFVRVADETATLGESMQSGEIKNSQTSILSTVVVGPGTLTFKWKTSCEHDPEGTFEWDHAEFWVDGKIKGQLDDETEWIEVSQRIEGDGEHTVIWRYVKDDVEEGGEDCLWVSDYVWETDYTETKTTEVPVPYDWLQEKSRDIVDEYDNYENVAKQKAYNPWYTVEQCYVAGLDPESTTNEFKMAISMEGSVPKVTWEPDLGVERLYKVWGRESLMSGDWQYPTNSTHRFFKVTVEMP